MARDVSTNSKLLNTAIAGSLGFLMVFPILWILILSFKTEEDAIRAPLEVLFGSGWTLDSYGVVQARSDYFKHFSNPDARVCDLASPLREDTHGAHVTPQGEVVFNYEYCKGCGVCMTACPRGAIYMTGL